MCGITGFIRVNFKRQHKNSLSSLMYDMLFMDTLRGHHATGFFTAFKDNKDEVYLAHHKDNVNGVNFVTSDITFKKYQDKANDMLYFVGHNRYATGGKHSAENAHPFIHDNVTLVHNGVLRNRYELIGKYPDVDSMAIAEYMATDGDKQKFINKADAAYSLVWQENNDPGILTLNFLRNHERPMWFVFSNDIVCFGSERYMIAAAMERNGFTVKKMVQVNTYDHHVFGFDEANLGTDCIFTTNTVTYKEPPPKPTYKSKLYDYYSDTESNITTIPPKTSHKKAGEPLSANALRLASGAGHIVSHHSFMNLPISTRQPNLAKDSYVMFCYDAYDRNPNSDYGTLIGCFPDGSTGADVEVKAYGVHHEEVKIAMQKRLMFGARVHWTGHNNGTRQITVTGVEVVYHQDPIWEESLGLMEPYGAPVNLTKAA